MTPVTGAPLNNAAHVVQLALTPIFLLTGLASLLNVFTTRLGRVADRVDRLAEDPGAHPRQLRILKLRSRVLDAAVILVTTAGGLTCCAALTLFFGALRDASGGILLFALFGGALVFSVAALVAFAASASRRANSSGSGLIKEVSDFRVRYGLAWKPRVISVSRVPFQCGMGLRAKQASSLSS